MSTPTRVEPAIAASKPPNDPLGRKPLGLLLLEHGKVSRDQLEEALSLQQQRTARIGELLCELGHIDAATLKAALAEQAGIQKIELEQRNPDNAAIALIPAEVAFRHKVLPVSLSERGLVLAMVDPFDRSAIETLRVLTGRRIERKFAPELELLDATRRFYGSSVARMIADLDAPGPGSSVDESDVGQLQELSRDPSVVNLVNLMIHEAVDSRASDIHIEPFEKIVKVRYRIDGVLQEMAPPPKRLEPAIISRLKIMAGMNIAERFVPQDGHITTTGPRGKVDLRVATVPTFWGECMVLRILDRAAAMISLEQLGMSPTDKTNFEVMLDKPHGVVLVTGPTGSGKTTTLYAALNKIYSPELKIITIEDPVEYQLEGVNQIAVNRKRGIDFAGGLRAILRQDPDIIMVGEIRDQETADIAIRSALTGHLVFATLHTNDAPGAVTRLADMGIEPFLLASSLEGAIAQRLVRTICPHCKQPDKPPPELLARVGHRVVDLHKANFCRGAGCRNCRNTGYYGRIAIFEILRVSDKVRAAILKRSSAADIAAAASEDHFPMAEDGYRKAALGLTTLDEVLRVTQDAMDSGT